MNGQVIELLSQLPDGVFITSIAAIELIRMKDLEDSFTVVNNWNKELLIESKLLTEECHRLWSLMDDIDTAGDMFKPEINEYFKYVQKKAEGRVGLFTSDGYKILRVIDKEGE